MPSESPGKPGPALVWFRSDLRIRDNQALAEAESSGRPVICLCILDETAGRRRPAGSAQQWWLHHSLAALNGSLETLGNKLLLRSGDTRRVLDEIIRECGAEAIYWNRRYDPEGIAVDTSVMAALRQQGLDVKSFDGQLLHEPTRVKTGSGGPFKVYTPFWRAFSSGPEPRPPFAAPAALKPFKADLASESLDAWQLLPSRPDWAKGLAGEWKPGEDGAHERLDNFINSGLTGYAEDRNIPGARSTSRLSPHLAMGEISPFQVWQATRGLEDRHAPRDVEVFRKEVVWREFAYHLLFHFPALASQNFNAGFDPFPWQAVPAHIEAWKRGRTGYPIVDAGMRQLWQTGWMHNRVRMIVASFLIKHLMADWRIGEEWFWDTLVDACPANNPASWQWVAGSGADAAPYYRIFNPVLQGEKFDTEGAYVRAFVPEIAGLPNSLIHRPWDADASELSAAAVTLGETYPYPIVEHGAARNRALAAYQSLKGAA